jgi:ribonuclease HII
MESRSDKGQKKVARRKRRSNPFRFDRGRLSISGPGAAVVAGADEVGRGCLAGPLVAAAVSLDYGRNPEHLLKGMTDSKALTPQAREGLYRQVLRSARGVSVVAVSSQSIDNEGLHRCNLRALGLALEGLHGDYDLALVDGFDLRRPDLGAQRLPGGDWLSAAVAAASVVAKVTRDRLMREMDLLHPGYGFAHHVGYGTREHQEALRNQGLCPLHRRSFSLVGAILRGEEVGECPSCDE